VSPSPNDPILLCYDRSEGARRAIQTAGELFPGRAAIALHAWSPIAIAVAAYGAAVAPAAAYDDSALERAALEVAEEGAELARAAGLDTSAEIAESTFEGTWHAILTVADARGAALMVMGARGLSTFKSLLLGSVSHGVAQHAHVPVLIVPPAERGE
jgi:nucleotide-binding universal stress UspA family protein